MYNFIQYIKYIQWQAPLIRMGACLNPAKAGCADGQQLLSFQVKNLFGQFPKCSACQSEL